MPILSNSRHERFAQALASGETADAAYVIAGYSANPGNCIRLKGNESVSARVRELQSESQRRLEFTVDDMVAEFDENRRLSIAKDQMAAANAASSTKAKVLGFVVDKFKDVSDIDNMTEEELEKDIARRVKRNPELRLIVGKAGAGQAPGGPGTAKAKESTS